MLTKSAQNERISMLCWLIRLVMSLITSSNAGDPHAVAVWRAVGQCGALVPAIRSGLNGVGVPAKSSFQDSTIDIGIGAK